MADTSSNSPTIPLTITFTGGLELLFSSQQIHKISLPSTDAQGSPTTIKSLIPWLVKNLMKDSRRELFVSEEGGIRPGILVLINEADWELEGEEGYVLRSGDEVLFVSTLHGG